MCINAGARPCSLPGVSECMICVTAVDLAHLELRYDGMEYARFGLARSWL